MSESLTTRQKVALCAALGAGVVVGASGLVVYQRLCQNVGLKVTGSDFSQEIATLTTHIERLRLDIESLKGVVNVEPSTGQTVITGFRMQSKMSVQSLRRAGGHSSQC